ncbi:MAG: efflux RND transporter periplasmic adaptor subunit [Acidobacteriota bacterium]|nr:efflux RND transporter periplasmic adaptor subunit [Acidobacteriota bacterium]
MRLKIAVLLGAPLLGLVLAGCTDPAALPPPPPPAVDVETPTQRDVTVFAQFTGNTRATESVEIRARVQGFLESFNFEPATLVKKGDLLFVIEREPYIAAKKQAEADLEANMAFERRAQSDLERLEQAVKTNAVSQQEVTRATAERDQARAAVLGAKAKLEQATIDLAYTKIQSPITGLISRQFVDPGNLVGRGEPTLLAEVYNVDPIFVYFEVNEQLVAGILDTMAGMEGRNTRERSPVWVQMDQVDRVFEGEIDYIDPAADPDTGTLQVRAVIPNPEARLLPGFFVRIRIPAEELPGALLAPETALSTDLGGRYLMVVDDEGKAQKRYIEPGQLEDDEMRVILEGIEPGERFITEGLQRARPGMPVTVSSN